MVAVIAGNGLGLDNSSLRSLGQASGGQARIGQGGVAQYLNVATGNLTLQNADEGMIFGGLPLSVLRTYNSQGQLSGSEGWLFGFSRSVGGLTGTLNTAGSTITRTDDDGSSVVYAYDTARGRYVSTGQSGPSDTLSWDDTASTWSWIDTAGQRDQRQETYDASGRLTALSDLQTGASYSFSYSNGQLAGITAADGDSLIFDYTGSQLTGLTIQEVPPGASTPVTRQQVGYHYDSQGRLDQVTTTLGSDTDDTVASTTTTYTYDGTSDRVASVSQSDGTVVSYTYAADADGAYRLATITTGSGAAVQAMTLSYDLASDITTVSNALGQATTYQYDGAGHLIQVVAPAVDGHAPTTSYQYDTDGNLLRLTDADGGVTSYQYDGNGNLLSVEDPTGHTVGYTYNDINQVLSQTVYTTPAQGVEGQPGYVAPGGGQTTYYVYDEAGDGHRLAAVIDPLGHVTGYTYTGVADGRVVLSSTQHGLVATFDLTGASPDTPPTLAQLEGWLASAPTQAYLGQSTRTDYTYDVRGQLATQTQWATVDSSGAGVLDAGTVIRTFVYDVQGRLLQSATERGADRSTVETSSYAYDGLGRLISRTDPLHQVTSYVYTDGAGGDTLAITQANGLTTTQVRNSAGQLVSSTSSASGLASRTTAYLYDAVGRPVATIDPAGQVSYTFYDADGRIAGTVDAAGAVTALRHDADGHVIGTTQYAIPVDTSGWVSAGALTANFPGSLPLPTVSTDDRTTHTLYDAAGRVIATIDAVGDVATAAYDGEGHAIATTAYATALTPSQRATLGDTPTWSALQDALQPDDVLDRTVRTLYDDAGRVAATIDAAGFVTVTDYDGADRVTQTIAYVIGLSPAQRSALGSAPTLAALQADLTAGADDQVTHSYYDGAGRVVAQVDAEGYLTTTAYDETTHTTTTARYAMALTASQRAALTGTESVATLVGLLGSTPARQVGTVTTNADDQVASSTAADGTVTAYSYNAAGQLLSTTVTPAAGQGAARTASATYDAFGETLTRVDGNQNATTYTYNVLGQRITATDPLGHITYTYYAADGRVAYTVQGQPSGGTRNARGNVTAYTYNAFGQVTATRRYASQLTLTSGSSSGTTLNPVTATLAQVASAVAALPVSASDANGLTTTRYTLDGQVASVTDGRGYQTAYAYDAFGDRTQVQQQLSAPGSALSAANSTLSSFGYDSRGERIGEVDGVGTAAARSTSVTYDAFGRVTSRTDGHGHVVTFDHDGLGRQVSSSQTVGGVARVTQTTYDAFDRVVTQTDPLGNVTAYQYDVASHRTLVTTPDGVQVATITDAYGDTVSVTDGAGHTTTYTYDADGQVLTVEDALGNTRTNQYDADGELTRTTDATGQVVTYSYDAGGRVLSRVVDPGTGHLNLTTTYAYDGEGRQLSVTDPTGTVTTYAYDADGQVLTQVQDAGAGKLNLTTTTTYDGVGKTLTVTVGAGTAAARTTQYGYDERERLSQQIVDPGAGHLNLTTTYAYDANDHLTRVTDANGHTTRYVYDEAGERIFTVDAAGAVTQTTYDADGRVTAVRTYATALTATQLAALGDAPTASAINPVANAGDAVSYTAYNAEGQLRYRIDPLGHVTETRYDAAGRVSETLAYAHAIGVSASELAILQASSATALSSLAGLVSSAGNTDANAHATLTLYDADGQVRFVVQQNTVNGQLVGMVSEQRDDAAGRVVARLVYGSTLPLSPGSSLSAQWSTDSVAQALASAPKQVSQSVYDDAGRLRYRIDNAHQVTETRYDADGRVLKTLAYAHAITVPDVLTVATLAAAVSAAGTDGAHIGTTTYDAAGRVLTTGDALGVNATYTYDATGLALTQADRDGHLTTTTYDAAGRKILVQSPTVTVGSESGVHLYTQYQYDGVGNVTAISQGAGSSVGTATWTSTTGYAYDAVGHQVTTTYPGGITTQVTYNALGQAVVDKDANGHYQYKAYDADGQVAYAVDADGYITGTAYDAYGHVTALTRYATALDTALITSWSAGQPLSLTQLQQGLASSASDRTLTTTYDQRNQKIEVTQPSISYTLSMGSLAGTWTTGAPTTRYTYDAYGNATSSATLIQGALTVGSTSTPAIWATTYTYYDSLDRAVMTVTPTGQYTDPQGYVTTTSYDAFGQVTGTVQYAQAISASAITTAAAPALPAAPTAASGGNRSSTFSYDLIGRKVAETDTGTVTYTGGTLGQLDGAPGAATASSITSYTYDGESRLLSVTVNGATTSTTYDAAGRVTSVTAPARLALVANWQSILQSTPGDDLTSTALYTTVSPVTTYVYDALGHALSTTTTAGGLSQTTQATYDARGNQLTSTDAMGVVTTSTYDNNGNVLTQSYTLTSNGTSSTVTTTYHYDANNQQLSTAVQRAGQSGDDSYTQVKYNAFGEIVAKGDHQGYEAIYAYDNDGNLIDEPDAKTGIVHDLGYDLAGRLRGDGYQGPGGYVWTAYLRDLVGRVISETTPSATAATGESATPVIRAYDRWNNVTSTTDANGNTTTATYDSQNHLIGEAEARVLVVSDSGVRTWTTPTKTWYYNVAGQLMGVTDENGHAAWNTYDTAGNLTTNQDAVGARTTIAYDALGRAVAQQTPPADTLTGPVAHITYTAYDALGQVIAQGDFLLKSDGTGRTQQAQQTYALNSHGDRIRVTDALGNTSTYDYDSQHRVIRSQTPIQHANGWAETFTYDVNGHKTGNTTADGDSQSWVVDYFGRVQSHTDLSGALTSYTYDASSGLLTRVTSHWAPAGQTDPAYLAAGWNGSLSTQDYTYDADGQIAQVTQSVDGVVHASDTYQYDANGNTVSDITSTSDGAGLQVQNQTSTTYDSHNRISVVSTRDTSTGVITSREVINYDAAGNRRAVFVQSAYGASASPISGSGGAPTGSLAGQTAAPGQAWAFNAAAPFVDNIGFGLTFTATQAGGGALPAWMHFNTNGTFSGTPTAAGSWSVTVTATDVNGQSVSSTFTVTVPVVGPVFTGGTTDATGSVHDALSFTVPGATDANGSALTYSATLSSGAALPAWLSFNAGTCTFSGTPPVGSIGSYALIVTATAANGGSASETLTLTIAPTAPVYVGGVGNQSIPATRPFSFSYAASDFNEADGDALTFSAGSYVIMSGGFEIDTALPTWMSFDAGTRTFSGTPPLSAENQSFALYLKGTNPQGQAAEAHFTVTVVHYVQPAPVYHGTLTNHTGVIGGSAVNFPLPSGAFTEPDGGALTYSAYVLIPEHMLLYPIAGGAEVGDTDVPAQWVALSTVGLSINATTGAITGVPTTLNYEVNTSTPQTVYQHDTSYQIEVVATNGQAETAAGTFTLSNTYAPPAVLNPIANPSAKNPGAGWLQVVQSTTFSDPAGYGLTYSATLSSGAALPSGLTWSGQSLHIGTVAAGTYTIKVTATDQGSASSTFTLTINNVAPTMAAPSNLTAVKGSAMPAYTAPAAGDANGDAITYSASNLPPGIGFNAATRTFSGTPTSTGSWTVTYKATDSHGAATSKTFSITVNAPAPLPPVYNGGIPDSVFLHKDAMTYTFPSTAFSSPAGETLTYTVWGLPSYMAFNAATRTFSVTANLSQEMFPNVTLVATDTDGHTATHAFSFDILPPPSGGGGGVIESVPATETDQAMTESETGTTPNVQAYWFTYDADNRVTVSGGSLVDGQILVDDRAGSVSKAYDDAGNVASELAHFDTIPNTTTYHYDVRNELVRVDGTTNPELRQYDADGRLIADRYVYAANTKVLVSTGDVTNLHMSIGGWLTQASTTYYDADGNVTATFDYGRDTSDPDYWNDIYTALDTGTLTTAMEEDLPASPPALNDAANGAGYGVLDLRSQVSHWDPVTGARGYDAADNATVYAYRAIDNYHAWHTTTYQVSYLARDGYLEAKTVGTSDDPTLLTTTDTSLYDAFGRRLAIDTHSAGQTTDPLRVFAYDAQGEILERRDGTATGSAFTVTADNGYAVNHYAYVEGQQVSHLTEAGTIDVLSGVTGFSNSEVGTGHVVAQAGDTMQSIAQAVYGDASLWYVVAEANGYALASDAPAAGQTLTVPQVTTSSNTANTFKPYDPQAISGSTTPSLPMAPPPPRLQCQTLSRVIAIAVQVIVSYYSGNPGAGAAAGNLAGQYSSMMFNDQFDWGRAAQFAVNPFSGSASDFARTIYDPPAAGAPGKADYKSAAIAGAAAYAGSYVGGLAGAAGSATNMVVSAGTQYVTSVELSKMAGYDASFSWRELGTSMAAAYANAKIADAVGAGPIQSRDAKTGATVWRPQPFSWELAVRQATAEILTQGANYVIRKAAGLSAHWDWQDVGADVFGNALGNALVGEIKASRDTPPPDHVNTMWPADIAAPSWDVDDVHVQMPGVSPDQIAQVPGGGSSTSSTSLPFDYANSPIRSANGNEEYWYSPAAPGSTAWPNVDSLVGKFGQGLSDGFYDEFRPLGTFMGEEAGRYATGRYGDTLLGRGLQFVASEQADVLSGHLDQTETSKFLRAVSGTVSGILDDPKSAVLEGYGFAVDKTSQGIGKFMSWVEGSTPDQIAYGLGHGTGMAGGGYLLGEGGGILVKEAGTLASPSMEGVEGGVVPNAEAEAAAAGNAGSVWNLSPIARGNAIESSLASTEYSAANGWYQVGAENNGYFPLVDFQQGDTLVSLKTVDTGGSTWMERMESTIDNLANNGATVNGQPANMVLDVRVQPGGVPDAKPLIQYGRQQGVTVIVKEYP